MPDTRGTGESEDAADPASYRCDRLVGDVEAGVSERARAVMASFRAEGAFSPAATPLARRSAG